MCSHMSMHAHMYRFSSMCAVLQVTVEGSSASQYKQMFEAALMAASDVVVSQIQCVHERV